MSGSDKSDESTRPVGAPNLISVVMPIYNGEETVEQQLSALEHQTYPGDWELVIVDNGSTDESAAIAHRWESRLPGLRVISATDGQGVGYACNAGASAARGDFIMFCHQDDVADPHWLEAVALTAASSDAVGGRNEYAKLNDELVTVWRPPPPPDRLPVAMHFLPFAVGANLGMWTEVFGAIGGWSEDRSYGGEDVDLCWRLQLAGYRLGYSPDAVMHFRFRSDLRLLWKQFVDFGRAEPHLFRKYREHGLQQSSVKSALKQWAVGLIRLPDLARSAERKGIWVRKMAYKWGRLNGSLESRTLYL